MQIEILGQVPSQKNSKNIGTNRHTGRMFVTSNKIVKDWQESASKQLMAYSGQAEDKVTIAYQFYVKDMRRRDLDNMVTSVNDALVKAGLLKDDSWHSLAIGAADAELDKDNPRVVLWIG